VSSNLFSAISKTTRAKNPHRICILTYSPLGKAGITPLSNLMKIFRANGLDLCLISGGDVLEGLASEKNVCLFETVHKMGSNFVTKVINHLSMQVKMLSYVVKASSECEFFIIFLGESLIIPMLALKIARKKAILMFGITPAEKHFTKNIFSKLWLLMIKANIRLADNLIVYSNRISQAANLQHFQDKILLAHEHIVDFTKFNIDKKLSERECVIGYIGRLSEVKGILDLMKAFPIIFEKNQEVKILIGGDGNLYSEIESFVNENSFNVRVIMTGWIPRNDMSRILNELKLLVLPSHSEALPNILLEAMSCGTPVLATPVGAIPDIIKDGETGFLLESSDPHHLANKIVELLDKPELLEKISKNAYAWVRENFSEEKTVETWRRMLQELELNKS
jgi:glycosyltransferase involved in cell wall biosynthesis